MAPMIPPSAQSKPHSKSDIPKAPTRSFRRSESGSISTGTDVPHMIRVTVLGLAGVTVDQSSCRDPSTKGVGGLTKSLPPPPSKMRAIVAFSRGGEIRGTTNLSKPLSASPKKKSGNQNKDPSRHVAVWAAGDKTVGSEVVFEAGLHQSDNGSSAISTASSSAFSPKSFDVTVALTEDADADSKIAIPLGTATLAIAGNECSNGNCITVDLPVMRLDQAHGLFANKSAPVKHPLISIQRKKSGDDKDDLAKKKKPTSLKKRFFKNKTPTALDRKAFQSAYSMDASGDAVLRVKLEVYEKSKESVFGVLRRKRIENSLTVHSDSSASEASAAPSDERRKRRSSDAGTVEHPDDEISAINEKLKRVAVKRVADEEQAVKSNSTEKNEAGLIRAMQEEESHTGSFLTDEDGTWADDEETFFSLEDNTLVTDDYTLSFTPKEGLARDEPQENTEATSDGKERFREYLEATDGELFLKMFGRRVRIPSCGRLPDDFDVDDDGNARVTLDAFGRQFRVPVCGAMVPPTEEFDDGDTFTTRGSRWQDELTMVSAKVFGRKVHVPMPRELIPRRDSDTVTTMSGQSGEPRTRSQRMLDEAQKTLGSFISNSFRYGRDGEKTFDESTVGDATASFDHGSVDSLMEDANEVSMEIEELLGEYEASELMKAAASQPVSSSQSPKRRVKGKGLKKFNRASRSPIEKTKDEMVEIDQDRASSEEDLSIYKLQKIGSVESVSMWGDFPENKDETLVEIDEDRAESASDPTIYKLDKGNETPSRRRLEMPAGIRKTKSSSSPQGVADVNDIYSPPAQGMDAFLNEFPEVGSSNLAQAFTDFMACRAATTSDGHVTYGDYQETVPPLIIPHDDSSVGDLTATTHEQQIASRSSFVRKKQSKRNGFGRVDTNSSWDGFSLSENYFTEYGEDDSLHPRNGQVMKVPGRDHDAASPGWLQPWREEPITGGNVKGTRASPNGRTKSKRKTRNTPVKTSPGRYFSSEGDQEVTEAGIEQDLELEITGTAVAI